MPRYRLSFRVDPIDASDQDRFRRDFYQRFGLKVFSRAWAEIDLLAWPRRAELIASLEDLQQRGVARPGSGLLIEELDPADVDRAEWFVLRSEPDADFELVPYPSIRADRVPPGRHILHDGRFVSERVKAAVEQAGLTDIEFVWMEDVGRYRSPQWYVPVAQRCLGSGVDHPWFHRSAPHPPQGVSRFDGRSLKAGWTTGDAGADRLLSMFPRDSSLGLMIHMLRRFDRAALPPVDLAYDWDADVESAGRPRVRSLCISARARRLLLDANVITAVDAVPVLIVDRPATGGLEGGVPCPPPMYTPSELASLRVDERLRKATFDRRSKPERRPTLVRSLKLLRDAKKARPRELRSGARADRIARAEAALGVTLPAEWIQVVTIADGGTFGSGEADCQIVPLDELPAFHRDLVAAGRRSDDDYPGNYLHVGITASGDAFALDLDAGRAAREGAVVLFNHEALQIDRRWDSIAAFLESMLGG